MHVILTQNPTDQGPEFASSTQCDCNCACPTSEVLTPVLSLPVSYYLELTPACNNRCPGCGNIYSGNRHQLSGLDGEKWSDVIDRLIPHTHHFKLTGGEATLHPDFAEIVQTIEDGEVPFTLFTNGRWEHPDELVSLLRNTTTCEGLLISLHGPEASTHEAFSGVVGSFDETTANIRRATDAGIDVSVSMVLTRNNWHLVEETLELALSLGANHVVCNRYITTDATTDIAPNQNQLKSAMASIESLRAAGRPIRFGNCIPQCFEPSSSRGCTAGNTFATVDPWGRMRPCNHSPLIAGNLQSQSVEEIWQGEQMDLWRSLVPSKCKMCPAFTTCHGGCRAQALLAEESQDPLIQSLLLEVPTLPSSELSLYAYLRPVGDFVRHAERDNDMLLHKGQVMPIPTNCDQVVSALDGTLTLQQIKQQYGNKALDWVGALHQEGMVHWATAS